jgi:hypothetical protein
VIDDPPHWPDEIDIVPVHHEAEVEDVDCVPLAEGALGGDPENEKRNPHAERWGYEPLRHGRWVRDRRSAASSRSDGPSLAVVLVPAGWQECCLRRRR